MKIKIKIAPRALELHYNSECEGCKLHRGARSVCVPARQGPIFGEPGERGGWRNLEGDPVTRKPCRVMFVGEAPGGEEDRFGWPFIGRSGRLLEELIEEAGFKLDDLVFTNIVKCFPHDDERKPRRPSAAEMNACAPLYLRREIEEYQPEVIVTVGGTATKYFIGKSRIMAVRGGVYDYEVNGRVIKIVPTVHPAAALYDAAKEEEITDFIFDDLSFARRLLEGEEEETDDVDYQAINDPDELEEYCRFLLDAHTAGEVDWIAVDCETEGHGEKPKDGEPYDPTYANALWAWHPYSKILSIQISHKERQGKLIYVCHDASYWNRRDRIGHLIKCLKPVLETIPVGNMKLAFDASYLYAKLGIRIPRCDFDPGLAHHCLHGGTEPNDLEYLAAKYVGMIGIKREMAMAIQASGGHGMGSVPRSLIEKYGCQDTDSVYRLRPVLEGMLEREKPPEDADVQVENLLDCYRVNYLEPWDALLQETIDGVAFSEEKHLELAEEYPPRIAEIVDKVRALPCVRQWRQERRTLNPRYSGRKKVKFYELDCPGCGRHYSFDTLDPKLRVRDHKLNVCACGRKVRGHWRTWTETVDYTRPNQEKWRYPEFLVGSTDKKAEVLYDVLGCDTVDPDSPRTTKREAKEQILEQAHAELGQLEEELRADGNRVDAAIRKGKVREVIKFLELEADYNKMSKRYSSYVVGMAKWAHNRGQRPDSDPDWITRSFEPPEALRPWILHGSFGYLRTGRMSIKNPPLQTLPRKEDVKEQFVSRFSDGLILAGDFSQAELRVLASVSRDPDLIEAMASGQDIHRFIASEIYRIAVEDVVAEQRSRAKTVIFGLIYGRSAAAIAYAEKILLGEAKAIIKMVFERFPGVKEWIEDTHELLLDEKIGGCAWGVTGMYYPLQAALSGEHSLVASAKRQAVNYKIQGPASHLMFAPLVEIRRQIAVRQLASCLVNYVHDSLYADVAGRELLEVLPIMDTAMNELPRKRHPWLSVPVPVDFELGLDWRRMMGISAGARSNRVRLTGRQAYFPEIRERLEQSYRVRVLGRKSYEIDKHPACEVELQLDPRRDRKENEDQDQGQGRRRPQERPRAKPRPRRWVGPRSRPAASSR